MEFHKKLALQMTERSLTLQDVCDQTGVRTPSTISRWRRGETTPTLNELRVLAHVLRVSPAYLADDTITDPANVPGQMPPELRQVVEKARKLGLEHAGFLLDVIERLGLAEAQDRLLGKALPGQTMPTNSTAHH